MRKVILLLCVAAVGLGIWYSWNDHPEWGDTIGQYVDNGDFLTLEARYSPERLMSDHRKELLADSQHAFEEPILTFYPYLLIDAKYAQSDKKTKEGVILWGLVDGEMVIDTETWETTHGFEDAINANANRNDFKILHALSKHKGSLTRHELQEELHLEGEIIEPWIESAMEKHLIVQDGSELHLHFDNPKILVTPQTKVKQAFVTKSYHNSQRAKKEYSRSQIEKISQAAFGSSFTIRNIREVFLPVYGLSVSNPDGTIFTTYWNALNGKQMDITKRRNTF